MLRYAPLALLALLGAPQGVLALGNDTYFLRGSASVNYDSNVFHISSNLNTDVISALIPNFQGKGDFYTGVGVGARLDLPVSRQRFRADVSATKYFYQRYDQLDYTGYGLKGAWDWAVGNNWSGVIDAGVRQARQTYSTSLGAFVPSLLKYYDASASARRKLGARWELQGGLSYYAYRYEQQQLSAGDYQQWSGYLGVGYTTPRNNSTGARLRYTDGRWPNRLPATAAVFDDNFQETTLSAVLDWRVTGNSRLFGDLGYAVRQHDTAPERDYNGISGRLNYDYFLSGKTTIRSTLYQTIGPVEDFFATYVKTTGVGVQPIYQLSGKTQLQGDLGYRIENHLGQPLDLTSIGVFVDPSQQQRRDRIFVIGASAAYQATRTFSISTGVLYSQRSSNLPLADYNDAILFLRGQIEF